MVPREKIPLAVRFWQKVNIPENKDDCFLWTAATNKDGYGSIGTGESRGHNEVAHRVSYFLAHGSIPKKESGLEVRHTCGNRSCVNPRHLVLGTHQENMDDLFKKSPHGISSRQRGETHGRAKFTEEQIRAIRVIADSGEKSYYKLAKEYGVNPKTMKDIVTRKHWKHIL